ncbi:MAG: mechanosensitive ion channel family protein, partial [Pseudomonadota bacterium]
VVSTTIFTNLTRILIVIIGVLIVLQTLGVSITPIITALGIGGLAVALALQDTLSNLFSGFYILISRQVRVGDYVKLGTGEEGYVVDITWRNTTLRALPNNIIMVPNSKLASAITTNYNLPEKELSVRVQVGVSYDSDLEHVEKVTIEVAKGVMQDIVGDVISFEPFIRYHTFADFSINFTVIMRAKEFVDQYSMKHEFVKRLHKRYREEGIEIPFPIRTVHMKDKKGSGRQGDIADV